MIEEGAMARLSRELTEEERGWFGNRLQVGDKFQVEEFLATKDNPDPQPDDIPVDFYYGSMDGGMNNVTAPADAVEVVMTAAQMDARTAPTNKAIADAIAGVSLNEFDGFEFYESDSDDDGDAFLVYGKTEEGYTFGAKIKVLGTFPTDM